MHRIAGEYVFLIYSNRLFDRNTFLSFRANERYGKFSEPALNVIPFACLCVTTPH